MKYTVVGVFESPLRANELVHVLLKAGFVAERRPGIADDPGQTPHTITGMDRIRPVALRAGPCGDADSRGGGSRVDQVTSY
jgi:hypothetical protein